MLAHTMGSLPHAPLASASVVYLANVAVVRWLVDAVAGGLVVTVVAGAPEAPGRGDMVGEERKVRSRRVLARRLSRDPGRDRRWPVRSSLSRSSSTFDKCWLLTAVAPRQPAEWLQTDTPADNSPAENRVTGESLSLAVLGTDGRGRS